MSSLLIELRDLLNKAASSNKLVFAFENVPRNKQHVLGVENRELAGSSVSEGGGQRRAAFLSPRGLAKCTSSSAVTMAAAVPAGEEQASHCGSPPCTLQILSNRECDKPKGCAHLSSTAQQQSGGFRYEELRIKWAKGGEPLPALPKLSGG